MKAAAAIAALLLAVPGVVGADATALGVGYICGAERNATPTAAGAVMLAGVGNGASPADTANREAQAWYDEGLNLYHAFNHNEAIAAFAKAAALDPNCALCERGVALSLGPTLNYGVTADQTALALTHAQRAVKLVKPGDTRAAALTEALLVRFDRDKADRDTLYAKAMDSLAARYPADDEIANEAAQALMLPGRGGNAENNARAIALIKGVLARRPNDTAAIHYYIHATEFVGRPADALPYAEKLAGLAPGASHLVHMAAHTLMHVGQYEQVAVVDAAALKVDADTEKRLAYPGPLSAQMYYLHNYTFGLAGALMAGDGRLALKYADHAEVAFPVGDKTPVALPTGLTRVESAPDRRATAIAKSLVAYGRYQPAKALALTEQPGDTRMVKIYRHYARGEAFATRGDVAAVNAEAAAIATLSAEASKAGDPGSVSIADIATGVLHGRAALLDHQPARAVELFAAATTRQEKTYPVAKNFDPPPWWYPVRRSLAAADLAAGKPQDAVREAQASLKDWPDDALALKVLSEAEAAQGHDAAARKAMAQAKRVWRGDLAKVSLNLV
ncbi:tetratricopeptide repeat protein [Phenylobacterium sp.]|uniref:tetratricopeptide repeat protein n=1 Tax=Phenylobacterium sp. TaxID=1871053 RepID=UPI00374CEF45